VPDGVITNALVEPGAERSHPVRDRAEFIRLYADMMDAAAFKLAW
jgi:hypothetical protein